MTPRPGAFGGRTQGRLDRRYARCAHVGSSYGSEARGDRDPPAIACSAAVGQAPVGSDFVVSRERTAGDEPPPYRLLVPSRLGGYLPWETLRSHSSERLFISSGETSSTNVEIIQVLPVGSVTVAERSPQNMFSGALTEVAPASSARR